MIDTTQLTHNQLKITFVDVLYRANFVMAAQTMYLRGTIEMMNIMVQECYFDHGTMFLFETANIVISRLTVFYNTFYVATFMSNQSRPINI